MRQSTVVVCRFSAALDDLLGAGNAAAFDRAWERSELERWGWGALTAGRRVGAERLVGPLGEIDRKLLAALSVGHRLHDPHVEAFRIPALERMQHASAAALTGARWGLAGIRTVLDDSYAPLARRYFALLALAEQHPRNAWPLFERYLRTPGVHHAFLAAAVDAARYYGVPGAHALVDLFRRTSGQEKMRRFLSPHILQSLYVINERVVLPFLRELLTVGHTCADPERCEVLRALVAVRRLTGRVEPNVKYADVDHPGVRVQVNRAEALFECARDEIPSVVVI